MSDQQTAYRDHQAVSRFVSDDEPRADRACSGTPWNANAEVALPCASASPFLKIIKETMEIAMAHCPSEQQRARTAQLNDQARAAMGVACIVETTAGFRRLTLDDQSQIRTAVAHYDLWTIAESHGATRDFGVIFKHPNQHWSQETPQGGDPVEAIFWSIVCFDHAQTRISEHPWDETRSLRVLTLMLTTEY